MILLKVCGQSLSIAQPVIASHSNDYLTARFEFTPDWNGCEKVATFTKGETKYSILLENDEITEDKHLNLNEGIWEVGVVGTLGNKLITTTPDIIKVKLNAPKDGVPFPIEPPSLGQQILNKVAEAEAIAQSVRQDADSGKFNGKTPVKGVDYFTSTDIAEMVEATEQGIKPILDEKANTEFVEERINDEANARIIMDNKLHNKDIEQDTRLTDLETKQRQMIEWSKGIIYDFQTDNNLGDKIVPLGGKYADVLELGGMSRKGYQLLNLNDFVTSRTINGITYTIHSNGRLGIKGTATSASQYPTFYAPITMNGTYTLSANGLQDGISISTWNAKWGRAFYEINAQNPTRTEQSLVTDTLITSIAVAEGKTIDTTIEIMLESGSVAHPYEPYTPSLIDAKVDDVEIRGRNLLNGNASQSTGGLTVTLDKSVLNMKCASAVGTQLVIPTNAMPNGTYTITLSSKNPLPSGFYLYVRNLDNVFATSITRLDTPITFNNSVGYLTIGWGAQSVLDTDINISIELGTTSRGYLPYHEPTHYPIPTEILNLPNYGIGVNGVYNYIDLERKKYVQRVGAIDLGDPTLGWNHYSDITTRKVFYTRVANMKANSMALAMDYDFNLWKDINTIDDKHFQCHPTLNVTYYCDNRFNTRDEFRQAVSGKVMYYELATPIETDIDFELNDISVESGGQIIFNYPNKDTYKIDVPNTEEYLIKLNEVI